MSDYTEANLRPATPAHCKHYITEWKTEISHSSEYWWTRCKLCGWEWGYGSRERY